MILDFLRVELAYIFEGFFLLEVFKGVRELKVAGWFSLFAFLLLACSYLCFCFCLFVFYFLPKKTCKYPRCQRCKELDLGPNNG